MTELRTPLKRELEDPAPEHEIRRIWSRIQARRAQTRARRELRVFARVGALGVALAFFGLLLLRAGPFAVRPPGPLLVGGAAPAVLDGERGGVELSDGSHIDFGTNAKLEVVDNSGQAFVSVLEGGRATFDVVPGGPRRWTIEAGLASVEVVGTRFTVDRQPDGVEVSVERGIVLVRGERVPDRIQRLTAGQRLRVTAEEAKAVASQSPAAAPSDAPAPAPETASSAALAASASTAVGFEALLARADAERRAGNLSAAESTLAAAMSAAPDHGRAAVAAFTLGKLLLDGSGRPADAARAFSRAVALGPPAAIAEDALGRLVEAEGRAGHTERARAAARQYAERYPNGPKLYAVTRWLGQH
ncbi:MAG TPA: FecR domain-containing protein [Polyangiaceae bacterium]|nr:FecR domain-containing protein [Polyangiaceae bacterium]